MKIKYVPATQGTGKSERTRLEHHVRIDEIRRNTELKKIYINFTKTFLEYIYFFNR